MTEITTDAAVVMTAPGPSFITKRVLPGSRVTLDKSAVPYASAEVTIEGVSIALWQNYLDPRVGQDPPIKIGPGLSRTFNLRIRRSVIDYAARTCTLSYEGDESILQQWAPLTDDSTPFIYQASIRSIVDYVLGKIFASLEPGGPDVDMTAYWDAANYVLNPTVQATGNWSAVNATVAYNTAGTGASGSTGYVQGNASTQPAFGLWAQAGGDGATAPKSVREGDPVVASAWVRSPDTSVTGRLRIAWFGEDDQPIAYTSDTASALTGSFVQRTVAGVAPRGAVKAGLFIAASHASSGKAVHADLAQLSDGPFDPGFFSGASTDTANYEYTYSGANNASQSNRLTLVDALDPEAYIWRAGQTAWDFLQAFLTKAGMVLWADELRQWWLAYPSSRYSATSVSALASTTSAGADTVDLSDERATPTGVIVRYTWTTRSGVVKKRSDTAGTEERVAVIDIASAWPGPGAAAEILARRSGDGRTQQITMVADYATTPGMTAIVNLPGAQASTITVGSVTFDTTGFMDITTVGMTG